MRLCAMTTPRGKAANRLVKVGGEPKWRGNEENERRIIERNPPPGPIGG